MKSTKVKAEVLLAKLKENRSKHRAQFDKALVAYRDKIIEMLDEHLADLRKGNKPSRAYLLELASLPEPEDHTADYTTAIEMVENNVDTVIEVEMVHFNRYWQDRWEWTDRFRATNSSYGVK